MKVRVRREGAKNLGWCKIFDIATDDPEVAKKVALEQFLATTDSGESCEQPWAEILKYQPELETPEPTKSSGGAWDTINVLQDQITRIKSVIVHYRSQGHLSVQRLLDSLEAIIGDAYKDANAVALATQRDPSAAHPKKPAPKTPREAQIDNRSEFVKKYLEERNPGTLHPKVLVELSCVIQSRQPYLIVDCPGTGIVYEHQTGGFSCQHPRIEGYVLPLTYTFSGEHNQHDPMNTIARYTLNWGMYEGPDPEDPSWPQIRVAIEQVLPGWVVDEELMSETLEAWLYVKESKTGQRGVLVWENSD